MRVASAVSSIWRAWAIALALGVGVLGMGAGLAHSEPRQPAGQSLIVQGLLPSLPNDAFVYDVDPSDGRGSTQTVVP